jgi:hypothetical protein
MILRHDYETWLQDCIWVRHDYKIDTVMTILDDYWMTILQQERTFSRTCIPNKTVKAIEVWFMNSCTNPKNWQRLAGIGERLIMILDNTK